MILEQARTALAPYVDNGRCSDTAAVRLAINEAQRRLYSAGNWIGLIKRWGVTVTNGTFSRPVGCAEIIRVGELNPGLPSSVQGTVVAEGSTAMVMDSQLTSVTQTSSDAYRVQGPYPSAVDVMGKVTFQEATLNSDTLVIDDLDALKLVILALFRETTNAPELADQLFSKAIGLLSARTELAKENARKVSYQHLLATNPPGTRGYARAKAALALTGADREEDSRVLDLLGDAERRLMSKLTVWETYVAEDLGGYISLPSHLESAVRINIDGIPRHLNGQTYRFLESGVGGRADLDNHRVAQATLVDVRATDKEIPTPGTILFAAAGTSRSISIQVEGRSSTGLRLQESLTVNGGSSVSTAGTFAKVDSILVSPTNGAITVSSGGTTLVTLQPWESDSRRKWYAIPTPKESASPKEVLVLARPKWLPKVYDRQRMQISNDQALSLCVGAIAAERAGKIDVATALENKATDLLKAEAERSEEGHSHRIDKGRGPTSMRIVKGRR